MYHIIHITNYGERHKDSSAGQPEVSVFESWTVRNLSGKQSAESDKEPAPIFAVRVQERRLTS